MNIDLIINATVFFLIVIGLPTVYAILHWKMEKNDEEHEEWMANWRAEQEKKLNDISSEK